MSLIEIVMIISVGVVGLFESQRRFEMFRDNDWEIMYLNRRVSFMKDFTSGKTVF